jgi:hypothetical protein
VGLESEDPCNEEYLALSPSHTACLEDEGERLRLSQDLKEAIVDQHNLYRGRVAPSASNMQRMVRCSTN